MLLGLCLVDFTDTMVSDTMVAKTGQGLFDVPVIMRYGEIGVGGGWR